MIDAKKRNRVLPPSKQASTRLWPGIVTMHYCRLSCLAVVLVGLTAGVSEGQSMGRWRMPSTPAQFFGCGYGPGHHAPMVRMPCCTPMSVQRLNFVPCQGCQGGCGVGCANQGGMYSGAQPAPQPYHVPQNFYAPQPTYGGNHMMQPAQACPCNASQKLFAAPDAPKAPQPALSEEPGGSTDNEAALLSPVAEPVPTPEN